jgi:hypothetical protein
MSRLLDRDLFTIVATAAAVKIASLVYYRITD